MGIVSNFLWGSKIPEYTHTDAYLLTSKTLTFFRLFSLFASIAIYFWCMGLHLPTIKFLTIWGVTLVPIYFICVCACYLLYKENRNTTKSETSHALWKMTIILCEVAFSLQVLIPPYYWYFLHPQGLGPKQGAEFWNTFCSHFVVAALIWVEVLLNKIRFYPRHVLIILSVGVTYAFVNYAYTKIQGEPVYNNLTWDSFATLYLIMGSFGVACLGFLGAARFSNLKFKAKQIYEAVDEAVDMTVEKALEVTK